MSGNTLEPTTDQPPPFFAEYESDGSRGFIPMDLFLENLVMRMRPNCRIVEMPPAIKTQAGLMKWLIADATTNVDVVPFMRPGILGFNLYIAKDLLLQAVDERKGQASDAGVIALDLISSNLKAAKTLRKSSLLNLGVMHASLQDVATYKDGVLPKMAKQFMIMDPTAARIIYGRSPEFRGYVPHCDM